MMFFERLSLTKKLLLIALVPLVSLVWFAQDELRNAYTIKTENQNTLVLANLSVAASALAHELQKERGMSAGYLGSKGSKFRSELISQHSTAAVKVNELGDFLAESQIDQTFPTLASQLSALEKGLDGLKSLRQQVLNQSLQTSSALASYTGLIAQLLDTSTILPKVTSIGEASNLGSAYVAFLQSKERAGIERAVMANTFAADAFAPGFHAKFQSLMVVQDTYMNMFRALSSPSDLEFVDRTLQGRAIDETVRMREVALERAVEGRFGIDSGYWFKMQTEKINLLKQVEDQLSAKLRALATDSLTSAHTTLMMTWVLCVATILLVLGITFVVSRVLMRQLGADPVRLQEVVNSIAAGDLSMDLDLGRPATGIFADAQTMQRNLRQRHEADQQTMAETGRVRQALDNVNGNVLIIDSTLNIIYVNDAIGEMLDQMGHAFRQSNPAYDRNALIDAPISVFLDSQDLSVLSLDTLQSATKLEKTLGNYTIEIIANPVFNADGERLGAVMEWVDKTDALAIEAQVTHVVQRALQGELSARIDMQEKSGFYATLSDGVNQLMNVSESVIGDAKRVLSAMADGKLDQRITSDYEGDYQSLRNDTNATVDKLNEVVSSIHDTSESVRTGANEIALGNTDLSQRTEEQAESLSETASSMAAVTDIVKTNADNAVVADKISTEASSQAQQGGLVVDKAVQAMNEINEASKKIFDIITVIDEIAFQTNLLALNASVEAARAGEQGRGFAVVASEVRNLAGRSASAAREIKHLIEDSGRKVEEGSRLVNQSGDTLNQIVVSVDKVSVIISDIASSSQEQVDGISDIRTSIDQMEEITQQNAALVEQATAASESLGMQADDLAEMVRFFATDSAEQSGSIEPHIDSGEASQGFDHTSASIRTASGW